MAWLLSSLTRLHGAGLQGRKYRIVRGLHQFRLSLMRHVIRGNPIDKCLYDQQRTQTTRNASRDGVESNGSGGGEVAAKFPELRVQYIESSMPWTVHV